MKKQMFEELLASVREGRQILRGSGAPSRRIVIGSSDVRAIRERTRPFAIGVRSIGRRQRQDAAELGTGPAPSHGSGSCPAQGHFARAKVSRKGDSSAVETG